VPGRTSNERLEFLGDAVLGLVVADHVFRTYPDLPESELTMMRAGVVSEAALAEVAVELGLGEAILLGKGEIRSGGRRKPSILSDALEAVIGATYLDGGWSAAAQLVVDLLGTRIADAAAGPGLQDYKSRLQVLAAQLLEEPPAYRISESGPDHDKRFVASVAVGRRSRGSGEGRSKKQAEQAAARDAWHALLDAARHDDTGGGPDA
jgi:ribonuclease-3